MFLIPHLQLARVIASMVSRFDAICQQFPGQSVKAWSPFSLPQPPTCAIIPPNPEELR